MLKRLVILSLIFALAQNCFAQTKDVPPPVHGEIVLESYAVESESQVDRRKKTADFLEELIASFKQIAAGQIVNLPSMPSDDKESKLNFSKEALTHLGIMHLRCSVADGVCFPVIDTLFETDLINSKRSGTASCPNLQMFWKLWLQNDMEKRHQHQVQIGFFKDTQDFNQKVRPSYIKCKDSIEKLLSKNNQPAGEFFKQRYTEFPEKAAAPDLSLKILQSLEKSNQAAFEVTD